MNITERMERSGIVISPMGRLDEAGAGELERRVSAAAGNGGAGIVLDASLVSSIDAAGLRALLRCATACHQQGAQFAVAALRPLSLKAVEAGGLLMIFDHYETTGAALAALGRDLPEGDPDGPGTNAGYGFSIGEQVHGGVVVFSLEGRLDSFGAAALEARLRAVAPGGAGRVVLDCGRMTYIDSTGLRAVLTYAKTSQQGGGAFAIADLQSKCRMVFEVGGFISIIAYHETSEAAVAALA